MTIAPATRCESGDGWTTEWAWLIPVMVGT
jgi:hypothetical protein